MFERVQLNRRTIGLLDRDRGVYRVTRSFPQDVARKLDAYGIDAPTLERVHGLGVEIVEVEEHRGHGVRVYSFPIEDWLEGPKGSLGGTGQDHYFVPLADFPNPQVLKVEPCQKRLGCGHRCATAARHWRRGEAHACEHGHQESA